MERPIESVDLAAHGRARFFVGQWLARKLMQMAQMLREKAAAPCRYGAAKSGRRSDLRLARSAGVRIAEGIREVHDRPLDDLLQKGAIVAYLFFDCGRRRLCQVDVSRGVPADRHQWMGGEFAELVAIQALLQGKRIAVDPICGDESFH